MTEVSRSNHVYTIYAVRNTSQFGQERQTMRCKILEAHREYMLVESLKRYNQKYAGAVRATAGSYEGIPVRRLNRTQALVIIDETSGQWLTWDTVRRREGTSESPGRARGGK